MSYLARNLQLRETFTRAEELICSTYEISRKTLLERTRRPECAHARFNLWFFLNVVEKVRAAHISRQYGYDQTSVARGVERARILTLPQDLGYDIFGGKVSGQPVGKSGISGDKFWGKSVYDTVADLAARTYPHVVRKSGDNKKPKTKAKTKLPPYPQS